MQQFNEIFLIPEFIIMQKITPEDPLSASADITAENIDKLRELFPELLTESGDGVAVNVDVLKSLVGDQTVTDADEKYGLSWHGKRMARQLALTPSTGTLRPCPEESVDWDNTQNVFIEGDNLEVLKLLQKSYANKVKMIYIDPPYNTGKDFVYKDNFKDNIANYKKLTGQTDEEGKKVTTNSETSGRFHTDWLNMIYPRLKLARNLLRKDGVIFISIDDSEVKNLKAVCDEVFGEENFVAQLIWEKIQTRKNSAKYYSESHDYILVYSKVKSQWDRNLTPRENDDTYGNIDNDPKGKWKLDRVYANNPYNADYTITSPTGEVFSRPQGKFWRYSEASIKRFIKEKKLVWNGKPGAYPNIKRYLSEVQGGLVPVTILDRKFAGDNGLASREQSQIMELDKVMDYPKPV